MSLLLSKIRRDLGKLIQHRLQVLGNLGRDHIGGRQISRVFQTVILHPEDVQTYFVALNQIAVIEDVEPLCFCRSAISRSSFAGS